MKSIVAAELLMNENVSLNMPVWLTGSSAQTDDYKDNFDIDLIALYQGISTSSFKEMILSGFPTDIMLLPNINSDHVLFAEMDKASSALLFCCSNGKLVRDIDNRLERIIAFATKLFLDRKKLIELDTNYINLKIAIAKKYAHDISKPRDYLETCFLLHEFIGVFSELLGYIGSGWIFYSKIKARIVNALFPSIGVQIVSLQRLAISSSELPLTLISKKCFQLIDTIPKWQELQSSPSNWGIVPRLLIKSHDRSCLLKLIKDLHATQDLKYYIFKFGRSEKYPYAYNLVILQPCDYLLNAIHVEKLSNVNWKLESLELTAYKTIFEGGNAYLSPREEFYFWLCKQKYGSPAVMPFANHVNNAVTIIYAFLDILKRRGQVIDNFFDYLIDSWIYHICDVKLNQEDFLTEQVGQLAALQQHNHINSTQISKFINFMEENLNSTSYNWVSQARDRLSLVIEQTLEQTLQLDDRILTTDALKYYYLFRRFLEQIVRIFEVEISDVVYIVPVLKKHFSID